MEGEKMKRHLRAHGITQEKAAEKLGISRQTLNSWLGKAQLDEEIKSQLIETFVLPADFFVFTESLVNESGQLYSRPLFDCEKRLAAAQATIEQLEIRLKEKDSFIEYLRKSIP